MAIDEDAAAAIALMFKDGTGDLTLTMEPDSVTNWLKEFGRTLKDITECRNRLLLEAGFAAGGVRLGSFPPSQQIAAKMVDRVGDSEGGMAWALEGVLLRLADIHEALRQSLAAQLDIDLDNQKIIDDVRGSLD